jgi:hypothetical protein
MEDSPCGYVTWQRRLVARFPCNLAGFSARSPLALNDPEPPRGAPNLSPEPSPREARICCRPRQPRRPSPRSPSHSTLWCAIGYQASAERIVCGQSSERLSSVTSVGSHSQDGVQKDCNWRGARPSGASSQGQACSMETSRTCGHSSVATTDGLSVRSAPTAAVEAMTSR